MEKNRKGYNGCPSFAKPTPIQYAYAMSYVKEKERFCLGSSLRMPVIRVYGPLVPDLCRPLFAVSMQNAVRVEFRIYACGQLNHSWVLQRAGSSLAALCYHPRTQLNTGLQVDSCSDCGAISNHHMQRRQACSVFADAQSYCLRSA